MKKTIWRKNYDITNEDSVRYLSKILHFNRLKFNFNNDGISVSNGIKNYYIIIDYENERLLLREVLKNGSYQNLNKEFYGLDAINKICNWIKKRI